MAIPVPAMARAAIAAIPTITRRRCRRRLRVLAAVPEPTVCTGWIGVVGGSAECSPIAGGRSAGAALAGLSCRTAPTEPGRAALGPGRAQGDPGRGHGAGGVRGAGDRCAQSDLDGGRV